MAVYFVWFAVLLFGGALTAFGGASLLAGLSISALGIMLTLPWVLFIPARAAVTILNNSTGALRSVGSGTRFILRPLERLDRFGEVRVFKHSFEVAAEAKNKDVTPLKVHLEYETLPNSLHRWFITGEEAAVSALFEERAKAKLGERVWDFGNRELVYEYINELGERVRKDLEEMLSDGLPFPAYCGVKINDFRIADVELPQAIRDAEVKKEVANEERQAKAVEWQSVTERADEMISKGMSPEKAVERIQVQDGKVQDKINRIDIGKNLAEFGKDIGKGIGDGLNAGIGLLGSLVKSGASPVTTTPAPVVPKPPATAGRPAQPRASRVKPPFKAVVEVNDPKLAEEIVKGNKKVELEVKDGSDTK